MSRIVCRTPSTGKAVHYLLSNVPITYTTIASAPDFSVPDQADKFAYRDPTDSSRAIKEGEIFFITPISAMNKDTSTRWIDIKIVAEDATTIEFGRVLVPAGDTALIPIQGRSLFKRNLGGSIGDILQVRSETSNTFDVWTAGEEKPSNEHSGIVS